MAMKKEYLQKDKKYTEIFHIQKKNREMQLMEFRKNVIIPIESYNTRLTQIRNAQSSGSGRKRKQEFQVFDSRNRLMESPEYNPGDQLLVPIRIDVEVDNQKFKDTFTWNLHETSITPATFSSILVGDMKLSNTFQKLIEEQIVSQLSDFRRFLPMIASSASDPASDMRIIVRISVTASCVTLNDAFETSVSKLLETDYPEYVASTVCVDLGLGGDFQTGVAHLIREQTYLYLKTFCLTGDDIFLPERKEFVRTRSPEREEFTPTLTTLTPDEQERLEKLQERESRRKRRATRGRKRNNVQSDMFGFTLVVEDDFGRGVQCLSTPDFEEPFATSRTYAGDNSQLFTYKR